jgi:hypothetical protein
MVTLGNLQYATKLKSKQTTSEMEIPVFTERMHFLWCWGLNLRPVLAKQALYHFEQLHQPFLLWLFLRQELTFMVGWPGL